MLRLLVIAAFMLGAGCGRIGFDPATQATPPDGLTAVAPPCFAPLVSLPACGGCTLPDPVSIALADVDRSGTLDLVVGDDSVGVVAVRRGTGAGSFGPAIDYTISYDAAALAVADFTGDGLPDIAAASWNSSVKTFRNLGDGTFGPETAVSGPSTPEALALADLDGDGDLDLVAAGEDNHVSVLLNTGGTFSTANIVATGPNFYGLAVADLDGNGLPDIVASSGTVTLTVLYQGPVGSWTSSPVSVEDGAIGVVPVDWNGDGHVDLAVAAKVTGNVQILLGDGTVGGWRPMDIATGFSPIWLTAGDLDGDGDLDLVAVRVDGGELAVLVNEGNSVTRQSYPLATSVGGNAQAGFSRAALGDLDGDGRPEIVVANPAGGDVELLTSARCSP